MPANGPQTLVAAIKAHARSLGFALVGVTSPDPPPHIQVYEAWLAAGRHGEMAYLATERARTRRADPRQILPDCQSILVLGVRYPAARPDNMENSSPATGRVASYAWGEDYHHILPQRMKALAAFIEGQVGGPVPNRWYTDTGPILERELAQRAGLGWIGKNTCLINPQQGSYFLLAELFLGIPLPPDPPFTLDRCGSCTRCLDACPTGCILPDRTIDASRCISYLTIEHRGVIPLDLRPQMGIWVFGCDVCQEVCPWNQRFSTTDGDPDFDPRPGLPAPDLKAELRLSRRGFNRKFKRSPVKRAKRRGYLRNLAIALGNSKDPAAVDNLAAPLHGDTEPLVRGSAAWGLGQIGSDQARAALRYAAQSESDPTVLAEIRAALGDPV